MNVFYPLQNWDEAWYAEIIRNMLHGKSFLVPFWNGQVYFDKPPLYFWLSLPLFKLFGPGEWQARLVSQIAAIVVFFLVYFIGKKLFSKRVGLLAVIALLSFGQVIMRFVTGNLDSLMIALFLASFYAHVCRRPLVSGLLIGLSAMVKGWIFIGFPALLILLYVGIVEKRLPRHWPLMLLAAIAPYVIWFAAGALVYGSAFTTWYLGHPAARTINAPLSTLSPAYFWFVLRDLWPWLAAVPFLRLKKPLLPILLTTFCFLLALNFLTEKLDWYVLPAYPLLAIVIGTGLSKLATRFLVPATCILVCLGSYNAYRVYTKFPDRSPQMAQVGITAKTTIPTGSTIVLDDHDMPAFLYYSEAGTVWMVSEGGGKPGEWWQLKYTDLPNFVSSHPNTWIVTARPEKFANLPVTILEFH